ncbi:alpha/beta fold hydrolase [Amycolatopsis sp. 195334CR]|uniref:alpha/beta hydrolase n=1 Tax=Amycolatopsis sp. 195334CR TaxID=2814588 RepID=UPI001A8D3BFA|nr:alpha/beta fold hydrolase [Amycolatopsis sp. 195334CR]MBN6033506.1 alpha/beta fold hydrolase [Amycolatopsis sp. 195334CR]
MTFVLVHGSNGNARSWSSVQRELALLGHRSLAVNLPGHGEGSGYTRAYQAPQDLDAFARAPSAMAGVSHADGVAHVLDVVRRVRAHGPVVLVGASRGGLVLTDVANTVPDLLDRVVYVSAWCCVDRTVPEYLRAPEFADSELGSLMPLMVGDPVALGATRWNWRTADPGLLAAVKAALFADVSEQRMLAVLDCFEPDEILDFGTTVVDPRTWGRIPHTYVRLALDRAMPPAMQDLMIAQADARTPDNPFDVHTLPCGHAGFGFHPHVSAFAAILDRAEAG